MKLMPGVERPVDDPDAVVVVRVAPGAEHHRAEAERGDLDAGAAERAVVHPGDPSDVLPRLAREGDLGHHRRREVRQQLDLMGGPVARLAVDHAQGAERVARRASISGMPA